MERPFVKRRRCLATEKHAENGEANRSPEETCYFPAGYRVHNSVFGYNC